MYKHVEEVVTRVERVMADAGKADASLSDTIFYSHNALIILLTELLNEQFDTNERLKRIEEALLSEKKP